MGPSAVVDYNLTLSRRQSRYYNTFTMGNPMPESRFYARVDFIPPVRD